MVADVAKRAQRRAETQRVIAAREAEAIRMTRKDDLTGNPVRKPIAGKLATEGGLAGKPKQAPDAPRKKVETCASDAGCACD